MAAAGVRWVQLRIKEADDARRLALLDACREKLEGTETALWLDDRADLGALVPVAGVHLGQHDLPPRDARTLLGSSVWIGQSTHDDAQVRAADADPAVDVVAVGPIFETAGKVDPGAPRGLAFVERARSATRKPLVAIGGIDAVRAPDVLAAGADAVAVIGAVCRGDVATRCATMMQAVGLPS